MEIKRLVPELLEDYLEFFDHIAFSDNPEWAGCYCVWYHWQKKWDSEWKSLDDTFKSDYNKKIAIQMLEDGIIQGYLAYIDGVPVGWCNANDRCNYERLSCANNPEVWQDYREGEKVKAIVCFTVAPQYRQQGISRALLKRVCDDAFKENYSYVEGYPGSGEFNLKTYHGPIKIFIEEGFEIANSKGHEAIVRKYNHGNDA